jgi:chemotaxis signal transduction protein
MEMDSAQAVGLDTPGVAPGTDVSARAATEVDTGLTIRRMSFQVGGLRLLLPMESSSELAEKPEIFRLPGAPLGVVGLANRQGRLVPTIDLAMVFGSARQTPRDWLLVCGRDDGVAGMLIDKLPETRRFSPDDMTDISESLSPAAAYGSATYQDSEGEWVEIDLPLLMGAIGSNKFSSTSREFP